MDSAARRWAELLDGWTIPDEILFQAPDDPWAIAPAAVAPPLVPADTPSRQLAAECLPTGGSVLDVGCGAGAASLALVPPAGLVVGVDASAAMLDAFTVACRARGVPYQAVQGEWPVAAGDVDVANVVVCHHLAYSVRDVVAMVVELTGRARARVVVELAAVHPSVALAPMWRHFWKLDRPRGPTAGDFLAVLNEAGIEPLVAQAPGRPHVRTKADAVDVARRRLCLPIERQAEVERALEVMPPIPTDVWTFAWAGDA
jgi:SAM-dependent methyltransferase